MAMPGVVNHQLRTPANNTGPTEALFVVTGANINFDEKDNFHSIMDVGWILQLVETLAKAQGHGKARYISSPGSDYTVK